MGNFSARIVPNTFVASRIELKGWGLLEEHSRDWDDVSVFDWDLTDRDQGYFDTKMMVFLWFKESVTPMVRKKGSARPPAELGKSTAFLPICRCEGYTRTRSIEETLEKSSRQTPSGVL